VWANSLGEYPGYILGWLIGIFFIIIFSTLAPPAEQLPPDLVVEAQDTAQPLTFLAVLLPSIIGLASGFGALMLMRVGQSSSSRVGRSLMIAGMMGLTLGGGYLMLLTDRSTRMLIAIFVLTFAIGALLNFIISRGVTASSRPSSSRYR
jgi:hypothetical protein